MQLRPATPADHEPIDRLLSEAAAWLAREGIDYWRQYRDPEQRARVIEAGITDGEFFLAIEEGEVVGMFRLLESDERWDDADDAAYLHTITTSRDRRGQGVGAEILDQIETLCLEDGVERLRLDCGADVDGLCTYYENQGFERVGQTVVDGFDLALYEREFE